MNLYNKHKELKYLAFGSISKAPGNRPLKLGQFFYFCNFDYFIG